MNISQTRQILAYLWASHPGAPRYTDDDKMRTIAAFFRVLYGFSVDDVLKAVDAVCGDKPTYIPSAYEVLAKCKKSIDVDAYLPHEYHDLSKALHIEEKHRDLLYPDYQKALKERGDVLGQYIISLLSEEQKTALNATIKPYDDIIEEYMDSLSLCRELRKKMEDLYISATWTAHEDYDTREARLAHKDLKEISDDLKALEG